MKYFWMIVVAVCAAIPAQAAERKFSIFGFDEIRVVGGVNVEITTGKGPSAIASGATREVLDRVSLDKNGSILVVSVKPKTKTEQSNFSSDEPVTVRLSTYEVDTITHMGSGKVTLNRLGGRTAKARMSGFGTLEIGDVKADRLDVTMTGGGQLNLSGTAKSAHAQLLGASNFNASGLTVDTLDLVHRGPARSHVAVKREVDINNSGTGMITIDGKPDCRVRSDGSAQIICNPKG